MLVFMIVTVEILLRINCNHRYINFVAKVSVFTASLISFDTFCGKEVETEMELKIRANGTLCPLSKAWGGAWTVAIDDSLRCRACAVRHSCTNPVALMACRCSVAQRLHAFVSDSNILRGAISQPWPWLSSRSRHCERTSTTRQQPRRSHSRLSTAYCFRSPPPRPPSDNPRAHRVQGYCTTRSSDPLPL